MRHLARAALFIIGVLSGYCWSLPSNSESYPVKSNCPQHFNHDLCHSSQEGVHGLDCYRQQSEQKTRCVWKPGRHSSNKTTYTLIIEQKDRGFCERYENISRTTHLFDPFKKDEMTVKVVDASSDEGNCTVTVFNGTPAYLVRCGPPAQIFFERNSRQLVIKVSWTYKHIKKFLVKYRELNSLSWKEVGSSETKKCIVGNLISSLFYEAQVQCVTNSQCHQCPWSKVAIVPPELTSTPFIEKFDVIPQKMGKRLIIAHWKIANNESVAGYRLMVGKESGEYSQILDVTELILRLTLSGSAYYISISAFNSAGTSPPANRTLPAITDAEDWELNGNLNVTLRSNKEFEISWNHSLTRTYCCYSVEWGLKADRMSFHSLYQKNGNHVVIPLKAPLQPYKRYVFLLHTRPDKDTCNLKSINNSESTNGRTEAYAKEGTPISAPRNITCFATSSSLALAWRAVSEQDACGFLLGYIVYYSENGKGHNSSVVIDGAGANRYTLSNLKSQTAYKVQLSAFTAVGEGVQSAFFYFETASPEDQTVKGTIAAISIAGVAFLLVANLCCVLCKRAKKLFWPSIPNPGNSNAIQKIDGAFELDVLEPLSSEKLAQLEETDASSLLIIEGRAETLPAPASRPSTPDRDGPPTAGSAAAQGSPSPSRRAEPSPVAAERRAEALPAVSDYTTMELFQQTMSRPVAAPQAPGPGVQAERAPHTSSTQARSEQDYIRQPVYLPYPSDSDGATDNLQVSAL
ncbi:hypothetical protein SKAU_G00361860 [Synaphobranchus kaupii]|uniref:Fibronectin type-III domain-containing protein n=1 Tax=Synaphobranchus kaupii TaxID=118154 RepID=A0A9Q1EII6_SYNKA|nr:hypothetical protein SKAU_G00361860 [Synaphobranchus kaupii]